MRREFSGRSPVAVAGAVARGGARRRRPTEITFYYPVAVGGPITKIIDGYAGRFRRPIPTSR